MAKRRLREDEIENPTVAQAEKQGWLARKLQYPGKRGAPDRLFVGPKVSPNPGRIVFMEFKRPGAQPNGLQKKERDELVRRGAEAYVVDSLEEAFKILDLDPLALQRLIA